MLGKLIELKVAITATGVELEVPIELSSSHWALAEKNSQNPTSLRRSYLGSKW